MNNDQKNFYLVRATETHRDLERPIAFVVQEDTQPHAAHAAIEILCRWWGEKAFDSFNGLKTFKFYDGEIEIHLEAVQELTPERIAIALTQEIPDDEG